MGGFPLTSNVKEEVYRLLLSLGTATINRLARSLGRKHETVARAVQRLEDEGRVNVIREGNTRYVALRPDSTTARVRPADPIRYNGGNTQDVPYARGSCDSRFLRAKTVSERVPIPGFVCHPQTKGCDLGREWVRIHVNGQYSVAIDAVGDFKPYCRDDDVAIEWSVRPLNTNSAYTAKVYLKNGDQVAYSIRAVSTRDGSVRTLAVYVHPRYVYYQGHEQTALVEFKEQVLDVCRALEAHGWRFDNDSIAMKGQLHTAINDVALGSRVGRYNELPGDQLHFDHSHGIPECEVYGSDPSTVELMVRLPDTLRGMADSLQMLTSLVDGILQVQTKTLATMIANGEKTTPQTISDIMYR